MDIILFIWTSIHSRDYKSSEACAIALINVHIYISGIMIIPWYVTSLMRCLLQKQFEYTYNNTKQWLILTQVITYVKTMDCFYNRI